MKKKKIFGGIIVAIGLGIFLYPVIKQAYSAHRQEELKDAFYEILDENLNLPTVDIDSRIEDVTQVPTIQADGTDYIDFEEADEVEDTQTASNIKNRLSGQTVIGLMEIDKIDLIYAIVEGTSDENLGVAVGHMTETKAIGSEGNCAIAGHRGGTSGPYFKNLHKLDQGDNIKITDVYGNVFIYKVTKSFVVEPTDVWVIEDSKDQKLLTLITCQDSGSRRLIVQAICE
jgi:sortase A